MSAHHILGLKWVPRGYGCSPFKVVRELGLERRAVGGPLSPSELEETRGGCSPGTRKGPGGRITGVLGLSCQWHCGS